MTNDELRELVVRHGTDKAVVADCKDLKRVLDELEQTQERAARLERALWRIHDREWPTGDARAGARHAAEMWEIADDVL